MTGLTYLSTTTSSVTFEAMAERASVILVSNVKKTGFCFDKGVTFAIFQDAGKPRSRNNLFNMSFTDLDKTLAFF